MPTPEIDENEVLYRQVGPGGDPIYFDPAKARPVHQSVFLPTKKDSDGLSLIRGRFRTEIWSAFRVEQPDVRFRLARLQAIRIREVAVKLGLQEPGYAVTPDGLDDQFGEPWAHCVVSSINRTDYDTNPNAKKRIKEWAMSLADLVSQQDVIGPFPEPTANSPYRPIGGQA